MFVPLLLIANNVLCVGNEGEQPQKPNAECPYSQPINKMIYEQNETSFLDLLRYTPDLNVLDTHKRTPLHIAILYGTDRMAEMLLSKDINKAAQDEQGATILHCAVMHAKSLDFINKLIAAGVPLEIKDNEGKTALHRAFIQDNIELAEGIMAAGASIDLPDEQGITPLFRAINNNDRKLFEIMIKYGQDLNYTDPKTKRSALHQVLFGENKEDMFNTLLKTSIDVNAQDVVKKTALHYAIIQGKSQLVIKALLDKNANVNLKDDNDQTAVEKAMWHYPAIIPLLLTKMSKDELAAQGYNYLAKAIEHNISSALKPLLTVINPNVTDDKGNTLLHLIAQTQGKYQLIKEFVVAGAYQMPNKEVKTPLDLAKARNCLATINALTYS